MDDKISVARRIRAFIRDLFGSRLVEHLEEEKFRLQTVYESLISDRDRQIAELKEEITRLQSKFTEYELDPSYFWWLAQRGRPSPTPRDPNSLSEVPDGYKSWAQIQREHYDAEELAARTSKESSNGVQDSGRVEAVRE